MRQRLQHIQRQIGRQLAHHAAAELQRDVSLTAALRSAAMAAKRSIALNV
ncbi:hypothetical protein [Nonomuraea sp. NPDC050202]